MKDLISPKAISVVAATIILGIIMSSAALITPAAAQNRLAENPDIHKPSFWRLFHSPKYQAKRGWKKKWQVRKACMNRCNEEGSLSCQKKYRHDPEQWGHKVNVRQVDKDCHTLRNQCVVKECGRNAQGGWD